MGWFRRKGSPPETFDHASGHESLRDVILEQSPHYEDEHEVIRPRGRAARLHPDAPAIPASQRRELEARERARHEAAPAPPPEVRTLWRNTVSPGEPSDAG